MARSTERPRHPDRDSLSDPRSSASRVCRSGLHSWSISAFRASGKRGAIAADVCRVDSRAMRESSVRLCEALRPRARPPGLRHSRSNAARNIGSKSPATRRKSWTSAVLERFLVRRQRWTLTWTGRLLTLTVAAVLTVILVRGLCGFLAISSPVGGQFLVVEGWMPTYVYREAATQFLKGGYRRIIAVGTTSEDADGEKDLPEYAEGERLINFGVPSDRYRRHPLRKLIGIERFTLRWPSSSGCKRKACATLRSTLLRSDPTPADLGSSTKKRLATRFGSV